MDAKRWNEIQAIVLFAAAVFIFLSLVSFNFADIPQFTSRPNVPVGNVAGVIGTYVGLALFFTMGLSSYVMPLLILSWAVARLFGVTPQKVYFKVCGTFFLVLASSSIFAILGSGDPSFRFSLGGIVGLVFSDFLVTYLGKGGALIVILVLFLLSVLLATEFLLLPFLAGLYRKITGKVMDLQADIAEEGRRPAPKPVKKPAPKLPKDDLAAPKAKEGVLSGAKEALESLKVAMTPRVIKDHTIKPPVPAPAAKKDAPLLAKKEPPAALSAPKAPQKEAAKDGAKEAAKPLPPVKPGVYTLPGMDLLDTPPPMASRALKEDLEGTANILEETLRDFDIEGKVVEINKGPVITRYELEPAPGVKVNRITSLSDNIALAMKAQSIRIVAPIPGKGTIGFEVPNSTSALVYLRDVLESKEYKEMKAPLKMALGKDIAGSPVIADLAKMPHLLIAGATGSGKTVCVNTIITSLLYNNSPEDLKLLMIDPKRVELAVFNDLPHLLSPVVTDVKKVGSTLDWIVNEMDTRYQTLAKVGVRNITLYNEKVGADPAMRMPFIVILIDELADLMMVAQADVEGAITRLAQLSRAVGIHIVIATQRPSVDIITGVIKANLPARIAFKVAAKVDSRTVLDMNGADKLLGRGDMLVVEPGAAKPVRAQCSLINDKEIERITDFIKAQRGPAYVDGILDIQKATGFKKFDKDEVYEEAVKLILESRQASVSVLQRRLGLGYTRAARLMDMMEDEGLVGPYQGSKPRDLLMTLEEYQARSAAPQAEGAAE